MVQAFGEDRSFDDGGVISHCGCLSLEVESGFLKANQVARFEANYSRSNFK